MDDEKLLCTLLALTLGESEHQIDTAANGRDAIEKWQEAISAGDPYSLMFVDLYMPQMDGAALIEKVREQDKNISIIVLTGQEVFTETYTLLNKFHVTDFIQKSTSNGERLRFAMQKALDQERLKLQLEEQNKRLLKYEVEERKKVEEERNILFKAVEQTSASIFITDKKGNIQYVNKAFETLTEYTKEEALNKTPAILNSGKHDKVFYKSLWNTILNKDVFTTEIVNKKKSGAMYYEQLTIIPILDEDGEIIQFLSTAKNLTRERELKMMQQDKLVTLDLVAMGVAHEINNPNTFVRGNAQALQFYWKYFGPALEEYAQEHPDIKVGRKDFSFIADDVPHLLEQMLEGTGRIKNIVDALLNFGHKGDQFVTTNLKNVIEQAHAVCKIRMKSLHTLDLDYTGAKYASMEISGSPSQLLQALIHLINNALDNMEDAKTPEKHLILRLISKRKYYLLQIQDNGPGIKKKNLEHIFEPFFTTKDVGKGIGLGLHICTTIILNHHGELTARNASEGGAIFEIRLPKVKS